MTRGKQICPRDQTLSVKLSVGPHSPWKALQLPVQTKNAEVAWHHHWEQNLKHSPQQYTKIMRILFFSPVTRLLLIKAHILQVQKHTIFDGSLEYSWCKSDVRSTRQYQRFASRWHGIDVCQMVPPKVQGHQGRSAISPIKPTSKATAASLKASEIRAMLKRLQKRRNLKIYRTSSEIQVG